MRIAVISDVHSNLVAMQAVLQHASPFDEVWCLGDIVGYGPDPNQCIALLRRYRHSCVVGNHDWAAIGKLSVEDFNSDAEAAALWTRRQLSQDSLAYLEGLPTSLTIGDWTLVHGSPRSPVWEYVLSTEQAAVNFDHFSTRYCWIGHSHLPLIFVLEADASVEGASGQGPGARCRLIQPTAGSRWQLGEHRLIVNPGAVGQPRDGVADASYVLYDADDRTLEFRRVSYDVGQTQERMRKAGLPTRLWARLSYGW